MQSTSELTPTETLIENAERHRRWLRRAIWSSVAFVVVAILCVIGNPIFVRWQLRQHGWILNIESHGRGASGWDTEWMVPSFGRIEYALLQEAPLRTSDVELLRRFNIEGMILNKTVVSQPAFAAILKLSEIRELYFNSTRLDAAKIRQLATLPNLIGLELNDMELDDSSLDALGSCHQVEGLILNRATIKDESLRHLSRLPNLHALQLMNCGVTDAGAKQIVDGCPGLKFMVIDNTRMTDVASQEFARLPNLQTLSLRNVSITDDGIRKLTSCSTLKSLFVKNTKVASVGEEELRKSLPTLRVSIE